MIDFYFDFTFKTRRLKNVQYVWIDDLKDFTLELGSLIQEDINQGEIRKNKGKGKKYVHENKTAALIRVSLRIGAIIAGGNNKEVGALDAYGKAIGLAFQITDDILDIGQDEGISYPGVYGLEGSRKKVRALTGTALKSLDIFGRKAGMLRKLAGYIEVRRK